MSEATERARKFLDDEFPDYDDSREIIWKYLTDLADVTYALIEFMEGMQEDIRERSD